MNRFHAQLVRGLLRCYPRAWRERYGEEFAALLAELPPSPGQAIDLARGAIDAHGRNWKEHAMGVLDTRPLDSDERRFWRRWVVQLLITGALIAVVYQAVPAAMAALGVAPMRTQLFGILLLPSVFVGPILAVIALGLGLVQWHTLRPIVPTLSRWWIAMALIGPLTALTIMTTDRSYSQFTDILSMANYFSAGLLGPSTNEWMAGPITTDRLILTYLLPIATFAAIAASLQAFTLKGIVRGAAWWIGIAMVAGIAGLAVARLLVPLRVGGYRYFPSFVRPDLIVLDTAALVAQLSAACAIYGIVSGLGFLTLRRLRQRQGFTTTIA